jgi:hypothetical protein
MECAPTVPPKGDCPRRLFQHPPLSRLSLCGLKYVKNMNSWPEIKARVSAIRHSTVAILALTPSVKKGNFDDILPYALCINEVHKAILSPLSVQCAGNREYCIPFAPFCVFWIAFLSEHTIHYIIEFSAPCIAQDVVFSTTPAKSAFSEYAPLPAHVV